MANAVQYHCLICSTPLETLGGHWKCGQCLQDFLVESRGLCLIAEPRESLRMILSRHRRRPELNAEQLAEALMSGTDCIKLNWTSMQDLIMEIRRNARLARGGQKIDAMAEELAFLEEFGDRLEPLIKRPGSDTRLIDMQEEDATPRARTTREAAAPQPIIKEPKFLERYLAGQMEDVWQDMFNLGENIRQPAYYSDAKAVVDETMKRAKHNIDLLHQRLKDNGYRFNRPARAVVPPNIGIQDELSKIEKRIGILPMSVRSFCEQVGSVNFTGEHSEITCKYPDSLYVDFLSDIWDEFDNWEVEWSDDSEPLIASFAPDYYTKSDVSGGAPYALRLPDMNADSWLINEPHKTVFVMYLQICFDWGGFPGLAMNLDEPPPFVLKLREGLVQIC